MNRRGFLTSCIALAAAPAIVRADSIMKIVPKASSILSMNGVPLEFDTIAAFENRIYLLDSAKVLFSGVFVSDAWDVRTVESVREMLDHKTTARQMDFTPEVKKLIAEYAKKNYPPLSVEAR